MQRFWKGFLSSVVIVLISAPAALAHTFSIDRDSQDAISRGFLPPDVLTPGPTVHIPHGNLGLTWPGDDLDALSDGYDSFAGPPIFFFSVDRQSIGIPGNPLVPFVSDVHTEAIAGQEAGDVFVTCIGHPGPPVWSTPVGQNMLHFNQQEVGLFPVVFPTQPYAGQTIIDDLDGLEFSEFDMDGDKKPDVNVYFSLDSASTSLGGPLSADDIFIFQPGNPTFSLFADGVAHIGLLPGDDLDALVLYDAVGTRGSVTPFADRAFFSLAPGSPSLIANGYSAADIFYTNFNSHFVREYTAGQLGLDFYDNIDALEVQTTPEPSTIFLVGTGCLMLFRRLRRREN